MIVHICNLRPKEFVHTFGDLHIYTNHGEQMKKQLSREPLPLPILKLSRQISSIDHFKYEYFKIISYEDGPAIKAPIAI
jgi:thymidylate synthase